MLKILRASSQGMQNKDHSSINRVDLSINTSKSHGLLLLLMGKLKHIVLSKMAIWHQSIKQEFYYPQIKPDWKSSQENGSTRVQVSRLQPKCFFWSIFLSNSFSREECRSVAVDIERGWGKWAKWHFIWFKCELLAHLNPKMTFLYINALRPKFFNPNIKVIL